MYTWKDNSPSGMYPPNSVSNQQQQQQITTTQPAQQRPPMHYDYYRSNPTSPTQQQFSAAAAPRTAYHPMLRGGVQVFPPNPSPQIKRKTTMVTPTTPTSTDARRRPMSFVRALEMTDSMEKITAQSHNTTGAATTTTTTTTNSSAINNQRPTTPTSQQNDNRASVYDMNYEISV